MKNRIRLIVIFSTVSLTILTACGTQTIRSTTTGVVPDDLQTIEAAAEDIIDFAPGGNWNKIDQDVTDIESAWKMYELHAEKDGASREIQAVMNSALTKLETASAAQDASATMQGSNDVSAAVVELFALYHPAIPADIGRLDVLERQVILDVAAEDYSAAGTSLDHTKLVWEEVKPSVLEHSGKEVAAQFEASLAAQESAITARDAAVLTTQAKDGLEIVDALEQLY